jgi:hypothetical protein
MMTTVKGFTPGETVNAFHQLKAQPWLQYGTAPPQAPLTSGVADVNGTLALDLPSWTPIALVRANGRAVLVENATTQVST